MTLKQSYFGDRSRMEGDITSHPCTCPEPLCLRERVCNVSPSEQVHLLQLDHPYVAQVRSESVRKKGEDTHVRASDHAELSVSGDKHLLLLRVKGAPE